MLISAMLAEAQIDINKANLSNTWLNFGSNTALPISEFNSKNSFGLGQDLSIQFLETKASGIGQKAGYLNYFGRATD